METITYVNCFDKHKRLEKLNQLLNRKYNEIRKEAEIRTKADKCFICGEKLNSFCSLHFLPKFVLE